MRRSLRQTVSAAFALTAIATTGLGLAGCIGAGTVSDVGGGLDSTFPTVSGKTLGGRDVTLPGYFEGNRVLVSITFDYDQQDTVDSWVALYEDMAADHPQLGFYEVPVADAYPGWFRFHVNNGLRLGIWGDDARAHTVTVFTDLPTFLDRAEMADTHETYTLLLDEAGNEIWRRRGPATPLTRVELDRVLAAAEPEMPLPAQE